LGSFNWLGGCGAIVESTAGLSIATIRSCQ
jgi:hypothetical protein